METLYHLTPQEAHRASMSLADQAPKVYAVLQAAGPVAAIPLSWVSAFGAARDALVVRQCLHWQAYHGDQAWWAMPRREWLGRTGLGRHAVETAKRRLIELRILGVRGRRGKTLEYRIDPEALQAFVVSQRGNDVDTRPGSGKKVGRVPDPLGWYPANYLAGTQPTPPSDVQRDASEKDAERSPKTGSDVSQENLFGFKPTEMTHPGTDWESFLRWWGQVCHKVGRKGAWKVWPKVIRSPELKAEMEADPPPGDLDPVPAVAFLIERRRVWESIRERPWGDGGPPNPIWPQGWLSKERWTAENLENLESWRRERLSRGSARFRRPDATEYDSSWRPEQTPEQRAHAERLQRKRRGEL